MAAGDGEINSGADVYSYSQIIQGVLILLSSLVAVGGYLVQSRAQNNNIFETGSIRGTCWKLIWGQLSPLQCAPMDFECVF